MAAKREGSGLRRAVEEEQGRGAPRSRRGDSAQSLVVAFLIGMVLLVLLTLWMRSNLVERIDWIQKDVSAMPSKLEPVARESAVDATRPAIDALTRRIENLEAELGRVRADLNALRSDVEMRARKGAGAAPTGTAGQRRGTAAPSRAPAGEGSALDDAIRGAVGDVR